MMLKDVVQTASDGKIDRLKVGLVLAELTKAAITLGYITQTGAITAYGQQYLADEGRKANGQ